MWYKIIWLCYFVWLFSIISAFQLEDNIEYSPILLDQEEKVLSARTSPQGNWAIPIYDSIPHAFEKCLTFYEDKRFYLHLGIDFISLIRAAKQNLMAGKVVSGGSTLTMQTVQLFRHQAGRDMINKVKECIYSIGFEFLNSKKQILYLYSQRAPYGGNVVGLQSAFWKYYGRELKSMSLSEACLLAVLPNRPSLFNSKVQQDKLLLKRNKLLEALRRDQVISQDDFELSSLESIPFGVKIQESKAPHLLYSLMQKYPDQHVFKSFISENIQQLILKETLRFSRIWRQNDIQNAAVIVVENSSRNVRGYLGNVIDTIPVKNSWVDMIPASRSSGSILKPLLFAAMCQRGLITPKMLLPDIPMNIAGFQPENFSRDYKGAVPADEVIQQSLNIPSVRMLQEFGVAAFLQYLKELGFTGLRDRADYYGLALILGGAEINAWDLAKVYSQLVYDYQYFLDNNSYPNTNEPDLNIIRSKHARSDQDFHSEHILKAGAIFNMLEAMSGNRSTIGHQAHFLNGKIAWKTGTSFGFKDAWCVGIGEKYTVVCWVGNSDGRSRPGLIGLNTAAPLMESIMVSLGDQYAARLPYNDLKQISLCSKSGFLSGEYCNKTDSTWIPLKSSVETICPYHEQILTDKENLYRVYRQCEHNPTEQVFFHLPPAMEYFYKLNHPDYIAIPPVRADCLGDDISTKKQVKFIYPPAGVDVLLPVDLDGVQNPIVLLATHSNPQASLYWYMDGKYLGQTSGEHQMACVPDPGKHVFWITDEFGNEDGIQVHAVLHNQRK